MERAEVIAEPAAFGQRLRRRYSGTWGDADKRSRLIVFSTVHAVAIAVVVRAAKVDFLVAALLVFVATAWLQGAVSLIRRIGRRGADDNSPFGRPEP